MLSMERLFTHTAVHVVRQGRGGWRIADEDEIEDGTAREVAVKLEIQGRPRTGYHLVMTLEGVGTADTHHTTKANAFEMASDIFGVTADQWQSSSPLRSV